MQPLFKHLLLSLLACISATTFCMLKFSGYDGIPGTLFVITIVAHFTILAASVLALILRFAGFISPVKFIYVFLGTCSLWMGMLSIVAWLTGNARFVMIATFSPNLLMGIAMLIDVLVSHSKQHAPLD